MDVAPPITLGRVLTWWTLDIVSAALVVTAGGAYLIGVRRLARRGRSWRASRSVSFSAGLAVLAFATLSGLARYDTVLFSVHVGQHLLLGMAAPILLALGAPVTLALQASNRRTQVTLLKILNSPPVRAMTHPLVAFVIFTGSLFVLYFTGLYELSLRNDTVHAWVHIHFVISGVLFFWVIVGLDPGGWPIPHWTRILLVFLAVPAHAVVGVAILNSNQVIAADWYASLPHDWGSTALADQRTGAAMLWTVGDVLGLVAGGVVVARWIRSDQRRAARLDRQLDHEAAASLPGPDVATDRHTTASSDLHC